MEKTIEKIDIRSLNYKELQEEMTRIGEKAFRGKQIYEWLHVKLADSFQEMTNLSRSLREKLEAQYVIRKVDMLEHQISMKDPTEKFLFELEDGNVVESVLMKYNYGNSVCISSQVGCRMGCKFCASTIGGKVRNLTTSEMLGQVYRIQKISGERVSNIVVMGTGEPLDNYDNFLKFTIWSVMNMDCISASVISQHRPVGLCQILSGLQKKSCRSHWLCHCMVPVRKNDRN